MNYFTESTQHSEPVSGLMTMTIKLSLLITKNGIWGK